MLYGVKSLPASLQFYAIDSVNEEESKILYTILLNRKFDNISSVYTLPTMHSLQDLICSKI